MLLPKNDVLLMLNNCQATAFKLLKGADNVFLTGVAGSGKSFLVRHYLQNKDTKRFPILASTGAAAILVGGRTFHSFFGLGIMQGGLEATVERALENKRLVKRLKKTQGVVIDEISMISGMTLRAAEIIAREATGKDIPWGGLQVIAVGDFAQLPPVSTTGQGKDWAFLDRTWEMSEFQPAVLKTIVRTSDTEFIDVLNSVRNGHVTSKVSDFLEERRVDPRLEFDGTRLFSHRETTERYNLECLSKVDGAVTYFDTIYSGQERYIGDIKKNAPVPERLALKVGALIMIRQNDPQGRWFNGSLGYIKHIGTSILKVNLVDGGLAEIEKMSFTTLNAEGIEVAAAKNFPVNLAYAATIHKSQGMTLDKVNVDLGKLWEPGQAYVALSRARTAAGLFVSDWKPGCIRCDPVVTEFNRRIWN